LIGLSLLAIVLVVIGLYSTTSALVTQLMRDISLRVALGATRQHVLRRTAGPMLRIALIGCAIGVTGALILPSLIASKLWSVNPRSPGTLLSALGIVAITIAIACWPPLRRGVHVDPARVLRTD
jgi:ABC-type antimicrobial peptide transport system permease subunit